MRISINVIAASLRKNPIIFRILFRVIITLSDSIKLRGLINLDVEINYIDKVIYKQLSGVVMILNLNIEIVSHSNYCIPFIGVCENVRLVVRFIKYKVCLFVIDVKTSYSLVLDTFLIF
jgi:hypothetical protein